MANNILISRTDSIGDVILTLPMAGIIKKNMADCNVLFLGNDYTEAVIKKSPFIDKFINVNTLTLDDLEKLEVDTVIHVYPNKKFAAMAKKAGIDTRVGTSHRLFHWWTCNRLVNFSRKSSDQHEGILNFKLLKYLNIQLPNEVEELHQYYGWEKTDYKSIYLDTEKVNFVFHMKSKGSAAEWTVSNFKLLAEQLSPEKFNILVTGTQEEGDRIKSENKEIFELDHVQDVTAKFNLPDFIELISQCDGLLACSTGPLHIAAASGINAIGLYPTKKPMHAGRWGPVGKKTKVLEGNILEAEEKRLLDIPVDLVRQQIQSIYS
ncbi:glycosyltransferase family 9 protein [Fulvivirga sp. M361]|uniref:glycosyltransferase family 9 protein n=1 Tax=Fulvivirga sp. M361 TaxID=2594266 RepID=UPI00117BA12C|nr:glycosyltransferase family 9 protein [Fulvivirga sp. M361]TRX60864.1 glycosyltransferase family 9 protein [Fulvivirga sp. M361]